MKGHPHFDANRELQLVGGGGEHPRRRAHRVQQEVNLRVPGRYTTAWFTKCSVATRSSTGLFAEEGAGLDAPCGWRRFIIGRRHPNPSDLPFEATVDGLS